jgi:prepilin-type N-terminal cleavage/methylation domain-containing protein
MLKRNKGFTLIELLVVISIIGLLSTIVLVSMGGARSKARDAKRQSDIRQILTAQEVYYDANNAAYYATGSLSGGIPAIGTYFPAVTDANYTWLANSASTSYYCAYALLENKPSSCATTGWKYYFTVSQKGVKSVCANTAITLGDCEAGGGGGGGYSSP